MGLSSVRFNARGGNRLARSLNAWPRLLSLFRLVHQGSHHPDLTITAYGGELFAPGDPASTDGLSRALSVFESACYERDLMSDRDVHRALELITRTRIKLRQGRSSTWVPAPVDFSDLSSEYIGILYEAHTLNLTQFFWFLTVLGLLTGLSIWAFTKPLNRMMGHHGK